jgi:single-strand DNA-binding protein
MTREHKLRLLVGMGWTVLACPTPSRKRRQPTRLLGRPRAGDLHAWPTSLALSLAPVSLLHAAVSTVPGSKGRADRPARQQEGSTMTEPSVSFAGNLTDDPKLRHSEGGIARAMFRVAVSGRREQEPSFFTVIVWRDQAEHAAESLAKGSRVVVVGRLQQRSWTAEDGTARSVVEVVAEELGPSLRWATARPERATRSTSE